MNNLIYSSNSEGAPLKFLGPYRESTVNIGLIQVEAGLPQIGGLIVRVGTVKIYGELEEVGTEYNDQLLGEIAEEHQLGSSQGH